MPRAHKKIAAPAEAPTPATVEEDKRSALHCATGTSHTLLQGAFLRDLLAVTGLHLGSGAIQDRGGALFALMASFEPRNAVEGMLAQQAAALNLAGMAALGRAANPALPPNASSRLRRDGANLLRCAAEMAERIDARRGNSGRQKIVVEYVDKAVFGPPPEEGS